MPTTTTTFQKDQRFVQNDQILFKKCPNAGGPVRDSEHFRIPAENFLIFVFLRTERWPENEKEELIGSKFTEF